MQTRNNDLFTYFVRLKRLQTYKVKVLKKIALYFQEKNQLFTKINT